MAFPSIDTGHLAFECVAWTSTKQTMLSKEYELFLNKQISLGHILKYSFENYYNIISNLKEWHHFFGMWQLVFLSKIFILEWRYDITCTLLVFCSIVNQNVANKHSGIVNYVANNCFLSSSFHNFLWPFTCKHTYIHTHTHIHTHTYTHTHTQNNYGALLGMTSLLWLSLRHSINYAGKYIIM